MRQLKKIWTDSTVNKMKSFSFKFLVFSMFLHKTETNTNAGRSSMSIFFRAIVLEKNVAGILHWQKSKKFGNDENCEENKFFSIVSFRVLSTK